MTKAMFINGSPRKNGNTAKLLNRAMEGAKSFGGTSKQKKCKIVIIF